MTLYMYIHVVQRDLGRLAHMMLTAEQPSSILKTLIFPQTKDDVYKGFSFLSASSLQVSMYHASEESKAFIQSTFTSCLRCLSGTIAFGMVC